MEEPTLRAILRLLEDDSPIVRQEISLALASLGPDLESRLSAHLDSLAEGPRRQLFRILRSLRREHFLTTWFSWLSEKNETARLEKAVAGLAWLESGDRALALPGMLDALADEFRAGSIPVSPAGVMEFLFRLKDLRGAIADFHHPDHSNLLRVLECRRGLPISLSIIAILVADRLGLTLQGLPTPRHFYVTAIWEGQVLVFDCWRSGRLLSPAELSDVCAALPGGRRSLARGADTGELVARVLRNLARSNEVHDDAESAHFFLDLEKETCAAK